MNKEKKEFAFDQNKLKEILTYHLNGNEYRLFDFISYKCRINDNWWEYTNEEWQALTGMNHRTFLSAKKSLEERGFITNLNKGQKIKKQDGTYQTKRNRLSVNVDFILKLKKEKETKSKYDFKSNLKKQVGAELEPQSNETKCLKSTPMEEQQTTSAKSAPLEKEVKTEGAKFAKTASVKSAPNNNKTIKKENNININSTTVPEENQSNKSVKGKHSSIYYKLKELLDSMYSSRPQQEFRSIQRKYIAYYNEVYKDLSSVEHDMVQHNYDSILNAKAKFYKISVYELYISTKEDDESFRNDFCNGSNSQSEFSKPTPIQQPKEEPKEESKEEPKISEEEQLMKQVESWLSIM